MRVLGTSHPLMDARLSGLADTFPECGPRRATGFVVIGRLLKQNQLASAANADLPYADKVIDQFPLLRGPQSFRRITSCSISLSRLRSATIRFKRLFSSSSCFKHRNSDGIKPVHFLRQRQYVRCDIPAFLQTSSMPIPSSACFKINAICCSKNLDFFIVFPRHASQNITRKFSL